MQVLMPGSLHGHWKRATCMLFLLVGLRVHAQQADTGLLNMVNAITAETRDFTPEKAYLQTDKTSYQPGDTLWFKSYVFDAAYLRGTHQSGVLYVEIADDRQQVIKRLMVSLFDGLGWGEIALSGKEFPPGPYTLRAYTNWMRNFEEHWVFQKRFTINQYSDRDWLIHAAFTPSGEEDRTSVSTVLSITRVDGRPVSFRDLGIELTDGPETLHKDAFRTDVEGTLRFQFKRPVGADGQKLSIRINDLAKTDPSPALSVPVLLAGAAGTDLQFMPEGGQLVAGTKDRVAFKATGENGLGQDVSGTIYNSRHEEQTSFKSTHLGMGSFYLEPKPGESYTAEIHLGNDQVKSYSLPVVQQTGVALHILNPFVGDSVEIRITTPGPPDARHYYYLVARSRGIGCFGALLVLHQGHETFRLSKDIFPTGIARFTLLDAEKHPLCQRMIFIEHHDELHANFLYQKQVSPWDSVDMHIQVTDSTGDPVVGSFSMAVTDDAQVGTDSLAGTLASYMLLSSGLKGYVEEPAYYFTSHQTAKTWADMDDLLLTQGWVSYGRDSSSASSTLFDADSSFSIKGKVTNILNRPVAGSIVTLFSHSPLSFGQATTNAKGIFLFKDLFPLDTAAYMLQARNKHGKSFNVGIVVDEFKPPVFQPLPLPLVPWYVNIDTGGLGMVHQQISRREDLDKLLGKHVLKEVVVVGQKGVKGSKNLNGPGGSDFTLDEADLHKAGKTNLGDLLAQKVKGFRLGGKLLNIYMIHTAEVHLIIDGVNLDFFKPPDQNYRDYYRQYLNYLTAEDIKGIEVMESSRYTGTYFQKFMDPRQEPFDHVFIEITTYSGNGAFLNKTPGVYLYRPPIAFEAPVEFYSPRYPIKTMHPPVDSRSTIFWKPDVVTDTEGKARVSFFTAGKPGRYTFVMEGSDMDGHVGSFRGKITVQ